MGEVKAIKNVMGLHNIHFEVIKHLPRLGMAEQRQFLLDQATAPYILFMDDDLILEPYVLHNMLQAIQEEQCGFVGSAVIGLSFQQDIRPDEQVIEFWEEQVKPENIRPHSLEWKRSTLHNAANLLHVQERFGLTPDQPKKYRVAWIGGCILFSTEKIKDVGGFSFWKELPVEHSGEDVLVQNRVMRKYGGCGLIPSGVYHQELPTTVPNREFDAPYVLPLDGRLTDSMAPE
jgi:GT2 family glycosyltransferase